MAGYDISGLSSGEKSICAPLCQICANLLSNIVANGVSNVNNVLGKGLRLPPGVRPYPSTFWGRNL